MNRDPFYYIDITPLLENCSKSLVSLRVNGCYMDVIRDGISRTVNLEHFSGAKFEQHVEYDSFEFPPTMRCLGIRNLSETSYPFVLPLLNQLRELELSWFNVSDPFQWLCLRRCPNLEVLYTKDVCDSTNDVCGDLGLLFISLFLKKLRKLTFKSATHMGLIAVAKGCPNLEYLHVELTDISNEALEFIGSRLKNLCDFDMRVCKKEDNITTDLPLDNGIRAMLMGCTKLERLRIHLDKHCLTDVDLGFIGKYGLNLRFLSLIRVGESDEGLLELSKGCPKLRKLDLRDCPFSKQAVTGFLFDIPSLMYVWGENLKNLRVFLLTRPKFEASTMEA